MRNHLILAGALLLSMPAAHASFLLPHKELPKPEYVSPILFPNGQSLEFPTILFGVSYIGGAGGQIERRVGTSGVVFPRINTPPPRGNIISAPSPWMNGFQFDIAGSTSGLGSHSVAFTYNLLSGNSRTATHTSSFVDPNILPSFAIFNNTGETELVTKVASEYHMPSLQDAILTFSRSLFVNPYLSVMVLSGLHGFIINHRMIVAYTDQSTGVTRLAMKELTYGAGPYVGFTATKKMADFFAFRAVLAASAPLSNHTLKQNDQYLLGNVPFYGYNTGGTNQLRQHFVGHLDLEAVFRSGFLSSSVEFILAWHVKQYINQSYLTTMSNNQNAPPSTIQLDTFRAGLTFIF